MPKLDFRNQVEEISSQIPVDQNEEEGIKSLQDYEIIGELGRGYRHLYLLICPAILSYTDAICSCRGHGIVQKVKERQSGAVYALKVMNTRRCRKAKPDPFLPPRSDHHAE